LTKRKNNGGQRPKRRRSKNRIFTRRDKDGTVRYYADQRSLGGKKEALKRTGERRGRATSDPEVAEKLLADRVNELLPKRNRAERLTGGVEQRHVPRLKAVRSRAPRGEGEGPAR
jgi:hypothetical protein